ncbi:hypothetical protein C8R44DRAFT_884853 [Mycena epipterygia]|nr:hypothetical protein C8R44DRAFT_884853 [Mycena epipterygia]
MADDIRGSDEIGVGGDALKNDSFVCSEVQQVMARDITHIVIGNGNKPACPDSGRHVTNCAQPHRFKLSRLPSVPHSLVTRSAAKSTQGASQSPSTEAPSLLTPLSPPIAESPRSLHSPHSHPSREPSRSPSSSPRIPTRFPLSSSSSDSSSSDSDTPHTRSAMTSHSKLATVEIRTGKLPTVHAGEITPLAATQFEHAMFTC